MPRKKKTDPRTLPPLAAQRRAAVLPLDVARGAGIPHDADRGARAARLRAAADVLDVLDGDTGSDPITRLKSQAAWLRNVADSLAGNPPHAYEAGGDAEGEPVCLQCDQPESFPIHQVDAEESVAAYYERKLGHPLLDDHVPAASSHMLAADFWTTTGCGQDCVNAIDAGAALLAQVRRGFGSDRPSLVAGIQDTVTEVIQVFVYG